MRRLWFEFPLEEISGFHFLALVKRHSVTFYHKKVSKNWLKNEEWCALTLGFLYLSWYMQGSFKPKKYNPTYFQTKEFTYLSSSVCSTSLQSLHLNLPGPCIWAMWVEHARALWNSRWQTLQWTTFSGFGAPWTIWNIWNIKLMY